MTAAGWGSPTPPIGVDLLLEDDDAPSEDAGRYGGEVREEEAPPKGRCIGAEGVLRGGTAPSRADALSRVLCSSLTTPRYMFWEHRIVSTASRNAFKGETSLHLVLAFVASAHPISHRLRKSEKIPRRPWNLPTCPSTPDGQSVKWRTIEMNF